MTHLEAMSIQAVGSKSQAAGNDGKRLLMITMVVLEMTVRTCCWGEATTEVFGGYRLRLVRREKRREFLRGEVLPLHEESESLPLAAAAAAWARAALVPISSLLSFRLICSSRSCCMSTCRHKAQHYHMLLAKCM